MEPKTTDQSTNHTPGSAPGSGSGAAPIAGEPSPRIAGASEFGATSGSSSTDASGSSSASTADVSFRGNTGGSSGAGMSGNTGGSSSAGISTSGLKNTIADRLEAGAEVVRSKGGNLSLSGATADASADFGEEGRLAHMGGVVADSMKATANWIREADVDGIREGLEKQVKEHPARSLLVAVGVGYLLGKAFRR